MALNEKDREEVRQTIAKVLADSIFVRVEHIIADALSAKVVHLQQAQAEAEAKAEDARKEMASFIERGASAERSLNELREQVACERQGHAQIMKELEDKQHRLEANLVELERAVVARAKETEEKIAASSKQADDTIAAHQAAIDTKQRELESMILKHARFKKSVGLSA